MSINSAAIRHSRAGGDIAGRDIIHQAPRTQMQILLDRLMNQKKQGAFTDDIIDELEHYRTVTSSEPEFLGLEKKLKLGAREDEIELASELKQYVFQKIAKHNHLEAAQEIYALLLSSVWSAFKTKIRPLIQDNRSRQEIEKAIHDCIIVPTRDMLDENTLRIYDREIVGFIYYLTGNCHLRWD
jgi:hypothetical protein